jgi:hypothetical protein
MDLDTLLSGDHVIDHVLGQTDFYCLRTQGCESEANLEAICLCRSHTVVCHFFLSCDDDQIHTANMKLAY